MSEDMVQLAKKYVGNISAKGLLYAEAIDMLVKGHQMVQAGTEALQHLEGRKPKSKSTGYGGTQGGLLVKAPKTSKAKTSNPDILEALHKALVKGPMTTMELALAVKCSTSYVRVLFRTDKTVVRVGGGNKTQWALRTGSMPKTSRKVKATAVAGKTIRRQAAADAADPAQRKKDEDKILVILKDSPKLTIGPLMRKLKRSFYPTVRAIKAMLKDGRLKLAEAETKNGRKLVTWVPA
jgi:hypothetical protein